MNEAFKMGDLDKDGFVSLDEWLTLFFHGSPQVQWHTSSFLQRQSFCMHSSNSRL